MRGFWLKAVIELHEKILNSIVITWNLNIQYVYNVNGRGECHYKFGGERCVIPCGFEIYK